MVKVGDIIDGRRVTRVFELCGGLAYQSEPVREIPDPKAEEVMAPVETPVEVKAEEVKKKRTRKKA